MTKFLANNHGKLSVYTTMILMVLGALFFVSLYGTQSVSTLVSVESVKDLGTKIHNEKIKELKGLYHQVLGTELTIEYETPPTNPVITSTQIVKG